MSSLSDASETPSISPEARYCFAPKLRIPMTIGNSECPFNTVSILCRHKIETVLNGHSEFPIVIGIRNFGAKQYLASGEIDGVSEASLRLLIQHKLYSIYIANGELGTGLSIRVTTS